MRLFSALSKELRRRLYLAHITIFGIITLGTIAFHYLEDLSWSESLYFTTTTVTTVGYGDFVPTYTASRIFTVVFILLGVGSVLYALSILAQLYIQREIVGVLEFRRRTKEMEKLSNHYIICGAGRVGRRIINVLVQQKLPHVIIDFNQEKLDLVEKNPLGFMINGDATDEAILLQAGAEKATGLATCLSDDAKNVYVSLTARDLSPNLHIVSRAVEEQAESKLISAGASRVVSPIIIGGQSMGRALIKPAIADFMESIVAENLDLVFEEITVSEHSEFIGKTLAEIDARNKMEILIVAIRRIDGEMIFNPSGATEVKSRDLLIVIGKAGVVRNLTSNSKS